MSTVSEACSGYQVSGLETIVLTGSEAGAYYNDSAGDTDNNSAT